MAPARRHPALHGLCPGRNFDSYSPAAGTPHSIPMVGSDRRKPPGSVGMGQSPTRAEKARSWFFRWKDKDFSFTDCTSFVVMRELGQRRALTTDHHFAQAGFEMVP